MDVWTFTRDSFFSSVGLAPAASEHLRQRADIFVDAVLRLTPDHKAEVPVDVHGSALASAPLFVPGTRYHISLSKSAKSSWEAAVRILATAVLLDQHKVLDLSVNISVNALSVLLSQITSLTPEQQVVASGLLALKEASESPLYWPTTDELVKHTGLSADEVSRLLLSMSSKVVEYVPHCDGWRVLF